MYTGSLAPFSNREDWIIQSPLIDDDGDEVDLSTADIMFYVTKVDSPHCAILTATTGNGKVTLPTATSFQVAFAPSDVAQICAGAYRAFLRVVIDNITTQIVAGDIQVIEGGPST